VYLFDFLLFFWGEGGWRRKKWRYIGIILINEL
jgi:hypothetical protein